MPPSSVKLEVRVNSVCRRCVGPAETEPVSDDPERRGERRSNPRRIHRLAETSCEGRMKTRLPGHTSPCRGMGAHDPSTASWSTALVDGT